VVAAVPAADADHLSLSEELDVAAAASDF